MFTLAIRRRAVACPAAVTILLALGGAFARAMVERGFFSHVGPGGATLQDRLQAAGYRGSSAGEVLAWGEGRYASPRAAVRSWLHSAPHRRVLLGRNYRDVGVGVALGTPFGGGMRGSATYAANLGAAHRDRVG